MNISKKGIPSSLQRISNQWTPLKYRYETAHNRLNNLSDSFALLFRQQEDPPPRESDLKIIRKRYQSIERRALEKLSNLLPTGSVPLQSRTKSSLSIVDKLIHTNKRGRQRGLLLSEFPLGTRLSHQLQDGIGFRLVLESPLEEHTQQVLQALVRGLEAGDIMVTRIKNYGMQPYLSQRDIYTLEFAAEQSLHRVSKKEKKLSLLNKTRTMKDKKSGYTEFTTNFYFLGMAQPVAIELKVVGPILHLFGDRVERVLYLAEEGKPLETDPYLRERLSDKAFQQIQEGITMLREAGLLRELAQYRDQYFQYARAYEKAMDISNKGASQVLSKLQPPLYPASLVKHVGHVLDLNRIAPMVLTLEELEEVGIFNTHSP